MNINNTWSNHFSFLPVKQIRKTRQKSLLGPFIFGLVLEDPIPEGFAEVQSLEDRIGVASVAKIDESKIMFIGRKQIRSNIFL